MKKCVLVSFFNSDNLGDVLIAETLWGMISKYFITEKFSYSGILVVKTNSNGTKTTPVYRKPFFFDLIYKILNLLNLHKIIQHLKIIYKWKDYSHLKERLLASDLLIIGGGNIMYDTKNSTDSSIHFNKIISIAKNCNKQIFVISIGIGPFKNDYQEKNAVRSLEKCNYLSFRDHNSYNIYARHSKNLDNAYITVDPVFFLPYMVQPKPFIKKTIGLNVFNYKSMNNDKTKHLKLIKSYANLAEALNKSLNVKIILFSTVLSDYVDIEYVYSNIKNNTEIEIVRIDGIEELIDLYSQFSLLIGTRMHSMIIAYTQHIPVIGLSWQPKINEFFKIIDAQEDVFNYSNIGESIEKIISRCGEKLLNFNDERDTLICKLNYIRNKENIDNEILSKIKDIYEIGACATNTGRSS